MKSQKVERRQDRQLRVCLTGGHDITQENADFCWFLGSQVALTEWITIVNGGLAGMKNQPRVLSADSFFVKGALSKLRGSKTAAERQILTLLPGRDIPGAVRFREGRTIELSNHSPRSRRFAMVRYSDLIVTVQGGKGIGGIVDLAIAYDKPVLPLAFTGGSSEQAWNTHKDTIIESFKITGKMVRLLESTDLRSADHDHVCDIARRVVDLLLHAPVIRPKKLCAVIMPISRTRTCTEKQWDQIFRIIKECVESSPYNYKCDRCSAQYGDVLIEGILRTLDNASIVIADVTDKNPNVLYELGYRHGRRPNTILIAQKLRPVPFDVRDRNILFYGWTTDEEKKELCDKLLKVLEWINEGGRIEPPGRDGLVD